MFITKPLTIKQPEAGKLIRERRSPVGLTQEQLALHLKVTYFALNRWGNQRRKPLPLAMQKIEAMLGQMGDYSHLS